MPKSRDHANGTDGYRTHINPDGSAVFLEGIKDVPFDFGIGVTKRINSAVKRRGLVIKENHNDPVSARMGKVARILSLERKFTGEPEW